MVKAAFLAVLLLAAPALAQTPAQTSAQTDPGGTPPASQAPLPEAPVAPPAVQAPAPAVPPPPPPPRAFKTVKVTMKTEAGAILLELESERAPQTTANFLKYADEKRYDGVGFYRAMKLPGEGSPGLVQAGTRGDPKKNLPPVAHEPTTKTGLSHTDGAISMARLAPGTAAGDFFIIIGALPSLDADPKARGDTAGFAVFGRVVEGMDVVRKIQAAPISPTLGVGVMKGQMLASPVKIVSVRRVK